MPSSLDAAIGQPEKKETHGPTDPETVNGNNGRFERATLRGSGFSMKGQSGPASASSSPQEVGER